jgi:hypothetical protein
MTSKREALCGSLPERFKDELNALHLNYPGYEKDLVAAKMCFRSGSKKKFLKLFCKLKGKQIAHDHCLQVRTRNDFTTFDMNYHGSDVDKRELQTWFNQNPPSESNVKIFQERIESMKNKNAVYRGDRSHPNIVALVGLKLSYPGCKHDVKEALQVHFSRPITLFPDKLHSLQAKQDRHKGDRSHWRLVKLDNLRLTYPEWEKDVEVVEDWHIYNKDNKESSTIFWDVIEELKEQEKFHLVYHQPKTYIEEEREQSSTSGSGTTGTWNDFYDTDLCESYSEKEFSDESSFNKDVETKIKRKYTSQFDCISLGPISEWYSELREAESEIERLL